MPCQIDLKTTAVILVDFQADFTSKHNGPLAANETNLKYISSVLLALKNLKELGIPIIATQDWHPPKHISFASSHPNKKTFETIQLDHGQQVLWPDHCIQNSKGAKLLAESHLIDKIIQKGKNIAFDSYSGFYDDGNHSTGLTDILKKDGITDLIVFGLATDYCVHATCIDAVKDGFKVTFIESLSRGVSDESIHSRIEDMSKKGVKINSGLAEITK